MNFPSVSNFSIAKGTANNPPEMYIPLFWYSGSDGNWNSANNTYNSTNYLQKGTTGGSAGNYSSTPVKLHTVNANWNANTKFAFEATIWSGSSGYTVTAQLWDLTPTTPTAVSASQISVTSTTATVVRSGQFTLTPGHVYGISMWSNNSAYITDASLIIFPS